MNRQFLEQPPKVMIHGFCQRGENFLTDSIIRIFIQTSLAQLSLITLSMAQDQNAADCIEKFQTQK